MLRTAATALTLSAVLLALGGTRVAAEDEGPTDGQRDRELEDLRARVKALEDAAAARREGEAAAPAAEEEEEEPAEKKWYDQIELHGFVDVYYAYSTNDPRREPELGENFIPFTGTSAKRHDRFDLNLAAIELSAPPEPVGFNLAAVYGTATQVVHQGEPDGDGDIDDVSAFDLIYKASVVVKAPVGRGLLFEAGIAPSHIGFEGLYSKDNWNYTRAWVGELSPYYQMGVSAGYSFTDQISAKLFLLNGWQIVSENNDAKAFGSQIAWSSDLFSISFNTFAGPELPDNSRDWRYFGDIVAVLRPTEELSFAAQVDLGYQAFPHSDREDATWHGYALFARAAVTDWLAFALRGEIFRDPENGISGFRQTLSEVTGTIELIPFRSVPRLSVRLETRYDCSDEHVFAGDDTERDGTGDRENHQLLFVTGVVVSF